MKRLLLILAACLCSAAHAQSYPNRPIKFVVPFPPGGNLDFVARNLQPKMQEVLGQPVLIDNKGGAAGMIGLEYAAKLTRSRTSSPSASRRRTRCSPPPPATCRRAISRTSSPTPKPTRAS
jgi:tripartite-type tricarboxylate transporter receptor subunit TctC